MKTLRELLKTTTDLWSEINAPRLGAALSFYTMLSLAPLLVTCVGIAGLVFGRAAAQGKVVSQLQDLIGVQGGQAIQDALLHAGGISSGLAAAAVGVFLLLFGASGVFGELRDSLNLVWGVKSASYGGVKGFLRYRFVSFAMVVGIGFLLMVSLVFSAIIAAAGKYLSGFMPMPEGLLHGFNFLFSFLAVTVLFALLYIAVPDVRIEWQDVWIGAAVTSALFSAGKFLIGLYLGKASVGSAYGAAGSLVVFLVWVYYSAQIFFLGAAFTRMFAERHGSRAQARAQNLAANTTVPERSVA
ncbi:MAG TPA: YihY/virulence factor BrkB family protein [Candidatus Sulfopaludibacter sp.]|nr:YihY/virulence factor BrkB family protein [Candidatus Sulfopaludibacter sp.]